MFHDSVMHRRASRISRDTSRFSMTEVEYPPTGAWPLNSESRLLDISGNGNHGEAVLLGEFRSGPGKNVSSYEITNDENSITFSNTNKLLSFTSDFTVAFWIYSYESEQPGEHFGSIGCFSPLIDWYCDPRGIAKFTWGIHSWIFNGKLAVDLAYNDNAQLETSFQIDQNRWTLCGFSFQWSQKILTMCVGSRKVKRRLSCNNLKTKGTVHIGRRFPENYGQDFKGRLCRLVMWDCLLTSGQVEEHMPLIFDVYAEKQKEQQHRSLRKTPSSLTASTSTLAQGWEKDLECPICYERLVTPRTLPCQHTLCLDCLNPIAGHKVRFECPICREVHLVPVGGVENFPTIPIVQTLLAAVDVLSTESSQLTQIEPTEAKCFDCHEFKKLNCCPHCDFPVCVTCKDQHLKQIQKIIEDTLENYEKHSVTQYAAHVKVAHHKSELENKVKSVNDEIERAAKEETKRVTLSINQEKESLQKEVLQAMTPNLKKIRKDNEAMSLGMEQINKIVQQGKEDLKNITNAKGNELKRINSFWRKLQNDSLKCSTDFPDTDLQMVKISFQRYESNDNIYKPNLGRVDYSIEEEK